MADMNKINNEELFTVINGWDNSVEITGTLQECREFISEMEELTSQTFFIQIVEDDHEEEEEDLVLDEPYDIDEDGNELSKDMSRRNRRNNRHKNRPIPMKGTSCFRKGYHKSEKLWKRGSRRSRRHQLKDELRHTLAPSISAIKQWAENRVFEDSDGYCTTAYGSSIMELYDNSGIFVNVYHETYSHYDEWDDEDCFYEGGQTMFYLSYERIYELGLTE